MLLPKANIHPLGENSPNLVTLVEGLRKTIEKKNFAAYNDPLLAAGRVLEPIL
jgi:hypothetical protein